MTKEGIVNLNLLGTIQIQTKGFLGEWNRNETPKFPISFSDTLINFCLQKSHWTPERFLEIFLGFGGSWALYPPPIIVSMLFPMKQEDTFVFLAM